MNRNMSMLFMFMWIVKQVLLRGGKYVYDLYILNLLTEIRYVLDIHIWVLSYETKISEIHFGLKHNVYSEPIPGKCNPESMVSYFCLWTFRLLYYSGTCL